MDATHMIQTTIKCRMCRNGWMRTTRRRMRVCNLCKYTCKIPRRGEALSKIEATDAASREGHELAVSNQMINI
jgi:hypothetical protein